jgi:tRNA(fMet)-specific endonuclease VapC
LRAELEKRGEMIGPLDALIAAHALRLGAVVVTRNLREFARVPGLKCENWQLA